MASDSDTHRRRIRNAILLPLLKHAADVVPRLSLETVQALGDRFGDIMAALPGSRHRRVSEHLRLAFPEGTPNGMSRDQLVRQSFRSMNKLFLEAVWVKGWKPERDDARLKWENEEEWHRTVALAKERRKGLIIFTAHLGSPEVYGKFFVERLGMPILAVAGPPKIGGLGDLMKAHREACGYKVIYRGGAAMTVLRHLRQGGALVLLVDHNVRGEGVGIPFFGREAHTQLAPARLALQSGAVLSTMFGLRDGPGRFRGYIAETIVPEPLPHDPQERFRREAALALRYTSLIEQAVRRNPEQYLWMHKRWEKRSDTLPYPS